jgi:integrase
VQVLAGNQVNTFLESIARGSKNSKKAYHNGLKHFGKFLQQQKQTADSIIPLLTKGKINQYELLDHYVSYLTRQRIGPLSLKLYVSATRSYLEFSDIDIVPSKFRRRVKVPRYFPDQEEPLTLSDIRELLEYNHNDRLRTFILLLASSGMRALEACSLRMQDVDFTTNPTTIHIRGNKTKTKRGRIIYCSNEATEHIHNFLSALPKKQPQDLIFALIDGKNPESIYTRLLAQFQKLQHRINKDQRKENSQRREITLNSFRRTAFSIINENTNSEFAHYYLGHSNSPYWTHKEQERRDIYLKKCMPFLTIYQETRDSTIENALREKDITIKLLTNRIADIELHQRETSEILRHLTPEKLQKIINN